MYAACPISGELRDERAVRVVAGSVVLMATTAILAESAVAIWILFALAADFAVRGLLSPEYSPLAMIARGVVARLSSEARLVDAAPKRFAARIGIAFSLAGGLLHVAGAPQAASAIVGVLVVCALLEALAGFCVGCKVYALGLRFTAKSHRKGA